MRSELTPEGVPERLWLLVEFAAHRLLMLDYDGTLAPFRIERDEALPLPGMRELLERVCASPRTRVAIVSGRPVREVERLLGPLPAMGVGEHGWESRDPSAVVQQPAVGKEVLSALDRAEGYGRSSGWTPLLERKRSALVLHTRSLSREQAVALEERAVNAWQPFAEPGAVSVDRIDGGVELRARSRDKGTVVNTLLASAPPGTLGVFLGDDVTDEDAFEAVRDRGFGVRVGAEDRPTLAMGRLRGCEEVPAFLERWIIVTGRSSA